MSESTTYLNQVLRNQELSKKACVCSTCLVLDLVLDSNLTESNI